MTATYTINGTTFASLGVGVTSSKGVIDGLKMKEPQKVNWPGHHGEVVDLSAPRYESREIILDCYIKADSSTAFILAVQAFLAAFQKAGLQRLMIEVDDGVVTRKPLVYEVYMVDGTAIDKQWQPSKMIGTFSLKLIEPEPVKRVLKYTRTGEADKTVTITVTSTKVLNFYWGDGAHSFDISGAAQVVTHDFTVNGTYYIVVTGSIDEITSLTSNGTVVWSKL